MKKIKLIIALVLSLNLQIQAQTFIEIQNGSTIDCNALNTLLVNNGVVCLMKNPPTSTQVVVLINGANCDEVIIDTGKELRIPANVKLILRNGKRFNLSGTGSIIGEHAGSSVISIGPDDTPGNDDLVAINMEDCQGCEVTNVTITQDNDQDTGVGLVIDEQSSGNEISSVKFIDINDGIVLNGDGNTFSELEFFRIGTDITNCVPDNNDNIAIRMNSANDNSFVNILHTRSPGAVTFWLQDICNNNSILNVSVEQEESHCALDPCIFIQDVNCSGNVMATNLNHGRVVVGDDTQDAINIICGQNSINSLRIRVPDPNDPTQLIVTPCTGVAGGCSN